MQRSWEEACKYLVSVAKRGVCVWQAVCVWLTRFGRPRCVHVLLWWCDTRCVVSDVL